IYNHHIQQRALNHQTPIQALKKWYDENPKLFVKRVYKQTGLDTYWTTVQKQVPGQYIG
ncbi:MAG: hypothetical protein PHD37_16050, partial [Gallionellaceae bacterium]|nr:hypothetical protein [Gallionellaceae bacterium]